MDPEEAIKTMRLSRTKGDDKAEREMRILIKKDNRGFIAYCILHTLAGIALGYLMCKYQ